MTADPVDEELQELVATAFALSDEGQQVDLGEICAERPDLAPRVRALLESRNRVRGLYRNPSEEHPSHALQGRLLLDRYLIGERLGSGAMGVVFRAIDQALDREVAVKILAAPFLDTEQATSRFEREAKALAALDHPAVVRVFDRGRAQTGEEFLVMELLRGRTLRQLLEEEGDHAVARREFSLEVAKLIAGMADGLEAAHQAGVLHRDIKPSNLFIRDDGPAAVLDFGLATTLDQESITRTGSPIGTLAYLAPEAMSAAKRVDPRADIYGLAATLYRSVTGRPPHSGSPSQIAIALAQREPTPVRKLAPWMDSALVAIIEKGMEKVPGARYQSAHDLAQDLRAYLAGRPTMAQPIGAIRRGVRTVKASAASRLAAMVAGLLLLTFGGFAVRDHWIDQRAETFWKAWRQLPPNFDIVGYDNRLVHDNPERRGVAQLLNGAVAARGGPLPALAVRANFFLDGGAVERAIQDMQALASEVGTPYAEALRDAYLSLEAGDRGAKSLDLTGLPEPTTIEDLYLAGYHALRSFRYDDATRFLFDERVEGTIYIDELAAVLLSQRPEHQQAKSLEIEANRPSRSATSAHFLGYALKSQGRAQSALNVYLSGLEIAPQSFVLLENAGGCAFDMRDSEMAQAFLHQAIALRPKMVRPQRLLVQSHLLASDPDGAEETLSHLLIGQEPAYAADRQALLGEADVIRAISAHIALEYDAVSTYAEAAVAHFDAARQTGPIADSTREKIARSLVAKGVHGGVMALFLHASGDPLNHLRLDALKSWLSREPEANSEFGEALALLLTQQIKALREQANVDADAVRALFPRSK